jgi:YidC/Oxa1 family membrane protein insertase
MGGIFDIINIPIGYLMKFCYQFTQSYGLAIILVAVVTKLLMAPLAVKQQKSALSQMRFQPRLRKIQSQYANDREKMQREMAKLQAEGYSPAAGCSSLLIQFPIMIGIYNVIRHPLKYIIGLNADVLEKIAGIMGVSATAPDFEINAINAISSNYEQFASALEGTGFFNLNVHMFGLDLSAIPEKIYNFLGIVPIPSFASWLIIIPVISAATAFLSSWLTQKIGPTAITQQGVQQTASMKVMNFLGPYMSYSIAMVVPAGLGLYWIVTNILTIFQTLIINKVYNPHEYMRKMEAEEAARKKKRKKYAQLEDSIDYKSTPKSQKQLKAPEKPQAAESVPKKTDDAPQAAQTGDIPDDTPDDKEE